MERLNPFLAYELRFVACIIGNFQQKRLRILQVDLQGDPDWLCTRR